MIKKVTFRNFRGQSEGEYVFGPKRNLIRGRNEAGKSSIDHLISFAFYGVDAEGTKNPDHLISQDADTVEVSLETAKAIFIRKKKRGATSTTKLIRAGLPELALPQTDLTKLLGNEFDFFASVYRVGYFMSLPEAKRLEVLSQAWKVDRAVLLREMGYQEPLPPFVKLANPRLDAQAVARERQMLQNKRASDEGALLEIKTQLAQLKKQVSQVSPTAEAEIRQLRAQIDTQAQYERYLQDYTHEQKRFEELKAENQKAGARRKELQQQLGELGECPEVDEESYQKKCAELKKQLSLIQFQAKPASPVFQSELTVSECPTCQQAVGDTHQAHLKKLRADQILAFNQLEREVESANDQQKQIQLSIEQALSSTRETYQSQCLKRESWKAKTDSINTLLQSCVTQYLTEPRAPAQPPALPEGAQSKLAELEASWMAAKRVETELQSLRSRAQILSQGESEKSLLIERHQRLEDLLKIMPEKEAEQIASRFHLEGAKVFFMDGRLVVTNEDGIPYESLSRGKKAKVGYAWCQCLRKLSPRAPDFCFFDDSDLVDNHSVSDDGVQVFYAKVDPAIEKVEVVAL